jgi:hypothetical protein
MNNTIHPRARSRNKKAPAFDANKLGKLLRLLSSDKDGEVLATVSAIKRMLDVADMDLHDVADAVTAGLTPRTPTKHEQQQPTRWTPPAPDTTFWESMAWWAHFYRQHLSTSDREYVAGTLLGENFDCGRADASMMQRLRNIVDKVEAARSAADAW